MSTFSSTSSESLQSLVQQGIAASMQGNSEVALGLFYDAAEAYSDAAQPHFLLGSEYAALGQMDKAEAGFANAVLLAPDMAIARYQLGLLQFSSGRGAMAMVTWQPILALANDGPLPHFVRGFEALAQDGFEDARRFFEAGIERNVENPPLTADIQKVVREIDRILTANPAAQRKTQSGASPDEGMEQSHILLSNYRQQGPGH